ncbi:MAG: hypothetical protein LCH95_12385 [Proteobacteria bacterium]|nr:hypothetical protein [Pseudomonadota bacterium]
MKKAALGVLLAAGIGVPAAVADNASHSLTGSRQLIESCQSNASTVRALCLGYLAAVADDVRHHEAEGPGGERIACLPPSPTIDQFRDAFLTFVAAHPEAASQRALQTVKAAMAAHWPCP